MKYLMGLDNGGSKTKCVIFDLLGNEIVSRSESIPLYMPFSGWTERDPQEVWAGNVVAIKGAINSSKIDPSDIIGIGLTGYGNGCCFVDKNGIPTYKAIVSTDSRTSGYLEQWEKDGTMKAVYQKTYQKIWDAQPAALIPWFRDNAPEVLAKTKYTLDIKDYIRFRLTGELKSEITAASSGCLMNIETKEYDIELFKKLGIEQYFGINPPFVNSTEVSGTVTKIAEAETGLKAGTPVSGGYFDIDAGALASGVMSEDLLCLIAGTWSINEYITADIKGSYGKFSNTVGYLPGYYVVEDSSPTSTSNFEWFLNRFMAADRPDTPKCDLYAECNRIIDEVGINEDVPVFVPYLYASASNPLAQGAFLGMSSFHERKHFVRAVYEGIVFSSCYHVKRLIKGRGGYNAGRLSGGVANSRVWTQMMCDALGLPIETLTASEQSALGAAMSAGIASGVFKDEAEAVSQMVHIRERFEPDRSRTEIYRKKFEKYEAAVKALDYFHAGNVDYVNFLDSN